MVVWNPEDPELWARALGLVSLPLFGYRPNSSLDQHTALIDGESAGIAFTFGTEDDLLGERKALSWSWSSNLTHAFVLDRDQQRLHVGRWDRPDEIESIDLPSQRRAADLVNSVAASGPPDGRTVVNRMIEMFRVIRGNVVRRGGNPADVVQTFNAILSCVDAVRRDELAGPSIRNALTLRDFLRPVEEKWAKLPDRQKASKIVLEFPAREFVETLLERDPETEYYLDPNLLLRHAAGALFQEAHIELAKPAFVQPMLFSSLTIEGPLAKGRLQSAAYFTPPSLARLLVEQTVAAVRQIRALPDQLEVLDPACGSGVFLIESLRELAFGRGQSLSLRAIDVSEVSCEMTRFCLAQAVRDGNGHTTAVSSEVRQHDSLLPDAPWGKPDIILMNPPFVPWRAMGEDERKQVNQVLGDLASGHSDKAQAFFWRAIEALKPGAALGTVLPVPLLEGRSGLKVRERVASDPTLSITFLGRFQGFGYFEGATVEPAFVVVSRAYGMAERRPVRVALATLEGEGRAIREVRRGGRSASDPHGAWEVFLADQLDFPAASWMPRRQEVTQAIEALAQAGVPTANDLFDIHLGIRTGARGVFVLTTSQIRALPMEERTFFRPVAENATIRAGRIKPGRFVFYPYGNDGSLLIKSEQDLRQYIPNYSNQYLFPAKRKLGSEVRKSLREPKKWWELVEPRLSWQPMSGPKIVSPCFGESGRFAYDARGRYHVVQGFAWLWKRGPFLDDDIPWAYLALLNSRTFERFLQFFCPQVRGGQFSLYPHHVGRVFLPDLSNRTTAPTDLLGELSQFGHQLVKGELIDARSLEAAVKRAYEAAIVNDPVQSLLRGLESLSRRNEVDAAINRVIGFFEDALTDGRLDLCDAALCEADVTKLAPAVTLSFLSMTLVEKGRLIKRADFYDRLRSYLSATRTEGEVSRLLKGLEN
jgi:adenine-specific DNA-methyltransferase